MGEKLIKSGGHLGEVLRGMQEPLKCKIIDRLIGVSSVGPGLAEGQDQKIEITVSKALIS